MKILIISLPRCGSTSLMGSLSQKYGLDEIFEPWNYNRVRVQYESSKPNIVLKTIIGQHPKEVTPDQSLNWLKTLTKEFDETILLSRKDLKSCAESWAYLNFHKKTHNSLEKYYYIDPPNLEWAINDIEIKNKKLVTLSKEINIPITYYEDIFNPLSSNRLRQKSRESIVIKKEDITLI